MRDQRETRIPVARCILNRSRSDWKRAASGERVASSGHDPDHFQLTGKSQARRQSGLLAIWSALFTKISFARSKSSAPAPERNQTMPSEIVARPGVAERGNSISTPRGVSRSIWRIFERERCSFDANGRILHFGASVRAAGRSHSRRSIPRSRQSDTSWRRGCTATFVLPQQSGWQSVTSVEFRATPDVDGCGVWPGGCSPGLPDLTSPQSKARSLNSPRLRRCTSRLSAWAGCTLRITRREAGAWTLD